MPATSLVGQGVDPSLLTRPATDAWPTYAGDYSQRRYSTLTQIDTTNVRHLTLAWVQRLTAGPGGGEGGFFAPPAAPAITGGVADEPVTIPGSSSGSPRLSGSILQVNGILYVSSPDNAWALDALDGHMLWHYWWKSRGGTHIGNRGMAMFGDWLFFETPDDYLVSLDAKTGEERWHKEIADFSQQYFSTTAPVLVGDRVLVGTGDDLDAPGFLQSFDPRTGDLQWKLYTVPMKKGDPGLETWASLDAARHGGAQVWIPGSYDPETRLYIFGTGNPTPAYTARLRAPRDVHTNLYTCSVIAVNVETGKMAWHYQTSPNDTHDWDSTQPVVLVDGVFAGKPRKMAMQASRNGYFYLLDRTNGEHLLTAKYADAANWAAAIEAKGQPTRNPEKDNTVAGSLVSPDNGGATNWIPPSYDPRAGLFYVVLREVYSMYYLTNTDPRMLVGLGGSEQDVVGSLGTSIAAIDYQTGKLAWKYRFEGGGGWATGLLTTAAGLLFASDGSGSLVAFGLQGRRPPVPLWHAQIGAIGNAPETYTVDGRQYVLVAAEGAVWAFYLQ
ncbi:MAG TPA: acido-empty-quinoprotein group A [Gemmatimonadales bacterium]|nr:acido-empty-quinoprotein group A [Gemmatimonadales bacterium]